MLVIDCSAAAKGPALAGADGKPWTSSRSLADRYNATSVLWPTTEDKRAACKRHLTIRAAVSIQAPE